LASRPSAYVTPAQYARLPPMEVMPQAKRAAEEALAGEPGMPEALTALASIQAIHDWDWAAAERNFKRAIQANPNYVVAHQWYAINCLAPAGRLAEARAVIHRALQLDPLSLTI